jgi:hypothetical protein
MSKKILLIIGILVIVGIAVFLIFTSGPALGPGESRVGFSIRDYLPFGNSGSETVSTTTQTISAEENASNTATSGSGTLSTGTPRLRKLSSEPVAGAVVFNPPAGGGTTSIVRFVEKGTGNVYEARSDSLAIERLTNTTIPKIIRAFWLPNGSGFLAQTLDSESQIIETSFVKLNKNAASSTSETLTPFSTTIGKLPTDIKEITIKPDGSKIFYYTISGSYSNWFTANPDGTSATLVATHPLTEWMPKWTSGNTVIMQTKESSEVVSYNYSFDVSTRILKKIGAVETGISSQTNTLIEKCVQTKDKGTVFYCAVPNYLPDGNYPDVWYKGLVSTEDFIEKIDISNDIFYTTANLSSLSGEKIDVVDPELSPDESHLIFRNKIDGYLWMLRIGE